MRSVADLKEYLHKLKASRNTRYGAFGEKIFAHYMWKSHSVRSLHKHGADFLVDGVDRVDVKTSLMLNKRSGASFVKVSKGQQIPGTDYAYVLLLSDVVALYLAKNLAVPTHKVDISWNEALAIFNSDNTKILPARDITAEKIFAKITVDDLTQWLKDKLDKKAKFVIRHNKKTQDSMARNGWGPEAFYHDPVKNKGNVDLVVLIYFDGTLVYDLFAYPLFEHDKISFTCKQVGPNLAQRKTFSPHLLSNRYKFGSVAEFKKSVKKRFF